MSKAIAVTNLVKQYNSLKAVDSVSFDVEENEIFGCLGPNGAGKTTAIRCMTTLTRPTAGKLEIFGTSVIENPDDVRKSIGYVPQSLSLTSELSGYENLLIAAKIHGVSSDKRREKIEQMLDLLGIGERANDVVRHYSGGMMRRLEIGTALIHSPKLLILDEPTIGLDPQGRRVIWELLRMLVKEHGITIFMTTHDMAEADALCQRIAIMNRGKIVAVGTPAELKRGLGGDIVTIEVKDNAKRAAALLEKQGVKVNMINEKSISMVVESAERRLAGFVESLADGGVQIESISAQKPTLDDVFLKCVGSRMGEVESGGEWQQVRQVRRTIRRMG